MFTNCVYRETKKKEKNMTEHKKKLEQFIWGTAISAYQTEGAWDLDDKGESIWDRFCRKDGAVIDGGNGDIACDSYHRFEEDIALLGACGLKNFRFSLSWPRILPDGTGRINEKGIDFYKRYLDELAKYDIEPWVTIYHWDLPQALQDKGGWENPESVNWFEEYCRVIHRSFGDRIKNWVVFNEPSIASFFGYGGGMHAPGIIGEETYLRAAHHMNLSVKRGHDVLRSLDSKALIGSSYTTPLIKSQTNDVSAVEIFDAIWNRNYLDPVMTGQYPKSFSDRFEKVNGTFSEQDLKTDLDFIGFQYYSPIYTRAVKNGERNIFGVWFDDTPDNVEKTYLGWEISPDSLKEFIHDFHDQYGKETPIIITENGSAWEDPLVEGGIDDPQRIMYFKAHLEMLEKNFPNDVRGYFYWSFLDNFEWADGYGPRFGLVHVDYDTLKRTPKKSFYWYKDRIKNLT